MVSLVLTVLVAVICYSGHVISLEKFGSGHTQINYLDTKDDKSPMHYNNESIYTGCGVPPLSRVRRIVGGARAKRCLFPWMVYISRNPITEDLCGGTLVSDRYVITAAHCFDNLGTNWPTLHFGEHSKQAGRIRGQIVTASYWLIVHPNYSKLTFSYDIAILVLNVPLPLKNYECVHPICLPKEGQKLSVGDRCTVAGWGSTNKGAGANETAEPSPYLMKTQIQVQEDKVCMDKFGIFYNDHSQICAGDLAGTSDSCVGDSGGPLMCSLPDDSGTDRAGNQILMGVISSGATPCAQYGTPAMYTDVQKAREWISSILNSKQAV